MGCISDREIVIRSGFLTQAFDDGDTVVADKGFTIQDLLPLGTTLSLEGDLKGDLKIAFERETWVTVFNVFHPFYPVYFALHSCIELSFDWALFGQLYEKANFRHWKILDICEIDGEIVQLWDIELTKLYCW